MVVYDKWFKDHVQEERNIEEEKRRAPGKNWIQNLVKLYGDK